MGSYASSLMRRAGAHLLTKVSAERDDSGSLLKATIRPPMGDPVEVTEWLSDDRMQAKAEGVLNMLSSTLALHVETRLLPQRLLPLTSKVKVTLSTRPNETFTVDENATQVGGAISTIGLIAATQTGLARHSKSLSS